MGGGGRVKVGAGVRGGVRWGPGLGGGAVGMQGCEDIIAGGDLGDRHFRVLGVLGWFGVWELLRV